MLVSGRVSTNHVFKILSTNLRTKAKQVPLRLLFIAINTAQVLSVLMYHPEDGM